MPLELMEKHMMVKIKIFSLIFLSLLISCCSVKKQIQAQEDIQIDNILGKYIKDDSPYKTPNSEEIILLPNNVVSYNLEVEFYGKQSFKGAWSLKKDTLNLSFNIPSEKIDGKIDVLYGERVTDTINLTLVDNENDFLVGDSLFINNKEKYIVQFSGEIKTKPQFIDNIKIVTPTSEIYDKKINKYVNTNMKIVLTPNKYRNALYDLIKTKWLVQGHKLVAINNHKIDQKYFLIKSK